MSKNIIARIGIRGLVVFSLLCLVAIGGFVANGLVSSPPNANAQTAPASSPPTHTITVTGRATYMVKPDMAYIYYNASAQAANVTDAISATNTSLDNLISKLKADGLTDADIQAGGVSVYPIYGPPVGIATPAGSPALCVKSIPNCNITPTVRGYRGNAQVTARVNDLTKIGAILTDSTTVNNVSVNNTNYTAKDSSTQRNTALTETIQNARPQADTIAASLGVKITGVASVSTSDSYALPYGAGSGGAAVPGPLTQTVTVGVSYSFS